MRLDKYLSETLGSRVRAQDAIREGRVWINGRPAAKPSCTVTEEDQIEVRPKEHDYVSRAGGKLYAAIEAWNIDLTGTTVLDIGASTGGFTQCALEHGADCVYALDVGHLQLSDILKQDPRVHEMEGINARNIRKDWFDRHIDFVCMDVSFISCRSILEPLLKEFIPDSMVILVKPQFEAGKSHVKGGIVRSPSVREKVLQETVRFLEGYYRKIRTMESPVIGRKGNQEYLLYACKPRTALAGSEEEDRQKS